jgi:tRNA(Ser,Leu) C12 N-acetylase TAN1
VPSKRAGCLSNQEIDDVFGGHGAGKLRGIRPVRLSPAEALAPANVAGSLVKDWNVIITIYQQGFRRAISALQSIGPTDRTTYYNVLVMKVDEPMVALETIKHLTEERPALYDAIARVAPAEVTFEFQTPEGFKNCTRCFLLRFLPKLAGRSFHVRLHRRGSKLDLQTPEAERLFNDFIVTETGKSGAAARVTFTEPDAVIAIDTVDDRAGIAMWTHEDLARYRLLHPD